MRQASVIEKPIRIAEPKFDPLVIEDIKQILESGQLKSGRVTNRFEKLFANRMDADYASAVSSGTAALHLALESLLRKGQR